MNTSTRNLKGENGAVIRTGTTATTGDFDAILCLEDTVFASYTNILWSGDSLAGVTIPAGTVLFGHFTAFTLTSGKVIAYKAA